MLIELVIGIDYKIPVRSLNKRSFIATMAKRVIDTTLYGDPEGQNGSTTLARKHV